MPTVTDIKENGILVKVDQSKHVDNNCACSSLFCIYASLYAIKYSLPTSDITCHTSPQSFHNTLVSDYTALSLDLFLVMTHS